MGKATTGPSVNSASVLCGLFDLKWEICRMSAGRIWRWACGALPRRVPVITGSERWGSACPGGCLTSKQLPSSFQDTWQRIKGSLGSPFQVSLLPARPGGEWGDQVLSQVSSIFHSQMGSLCKLVQGDNSVTLVRCHYLKSLFLEDRVIV